MQQNSSTAAQYYYDGGHQVISTYQNGERISFRADFTGSNYDGDNFVAKSSTGALVVPNATDKVIDITDGGGNAFIKAYTASQAGVIDGRGLAGTEIIKGSTGSDTIYAGDGGSQLWGGNDDKSDVIFGGGGADTFTGGNGEDTFISGKNQGSDTFKNISPQDTIQLSDVTLNDIVDVKEVNGIISITFNTGNTITIKSSELLSAEIQLADGTSHRFNHMTKTWQ